MDGNFDTNKARISPGEHLRNEIKRRGFDQGSFAKELDVSRSIINYAVNGKPISSGLARTLSKYMDLPTDYWHQASFLDIPADIQAKRSSSLSSPNGHVGVLVDQDIEALIVDGHIEIEPFSPENLRQASLDLSVGSTVLEMGGKTVQCSDTDPYFLAPGNTVNLVTNERVFLKNFCVARAGGTTGHARLGIQIIHGFQVDPGFDGPLQFCVHNFGTSSFRIVPGLPMLSVEFSTISSAPLMDFSQQSKDQAETRREIGLQSALDTFAKLVVDLLSKDVSIKEEDGQFQAEIPSLKLPFCEYSSKGLARDGVVRMLELRLGRMLNASDGAPCDRRFNRDIEEVLRNTKIGRSRTLQILNDMGFEMEDDFIFSHGPELQVLIDIPGEGGRTNLWTILKAILPDEDLLPKDI